MAGFDSRPGDLTRWRKPCLGRGTAAHLVTAALCVVVAAFIWSVFRPGVIDFDALLQIEEAKTGRIRDWLPFIMTGALRLVFLAGYDVDTITIVQSVSGCLGVYYLACALLEHFFEHRIAEPGRRCLGLGVLLLLLTPFTPLLYYLVWFRNDTWTAILLVWSGVAWLRLDRATPSSAQQRRWTIAAVALALAVCLARHNAKALLPVFCLLVVHCLGRANRRTAAVAMVALLTALPLASRSLAYFFHVQRSHPEMQVMALDLVGLCVEDERLRAKFPYTNKNLFLDSYKAAYVPGFIGPVCGYAAPLCVNPDYAWNRDGLVADYRLAVTHCPAKLVGVKLRAFAAMLFDANAHWHYGEIHGNAFQLAFNPQFEFLRGTLAYLDRAVRQDSFLAFFCARHLPWLAGTLLAVLFTGSVYVLGRRRPWLTRLLLLLLPLGYYLSYLAAATVHDYRLMYPATLFVQVSAATLLLGHIAVRINGLVAAERDATGPI